MLHKRHGSMPWAELVKPAINLARYGFIIGSDLNDVMDSFGNDSFLSTDPTWAIDFAPNGTRLGLGDLLTRKRYAATLETIAEKGADAFYVGSIANATIKAIQATNGTMTIEDLSNYTATIRDPIQISYRDYKLTSCGAPSGGIVSLNVLKTVSGYTEFGSPEMVNLSTHRLDEAIRFGYGAVRFHCGIL
jgi:gamma-glutamyltranspeptidase/glutathione hydrolase